MLVLGQDGVVGLQVVLLQQRLAVPDLHVQQGCQSCFVSEVSSDPESDVRLPMASSVGELILCWVRGAMRSL